MHNDSRSGDALARLLTSLRPDQLTVELCPKALTYRQTHGAMLLRKLEMILERLSSRAAPPASALGQHPDIVTIRNLLGLPYEYHVARTYAGEQGIEVHAIDETDVSVHKLQPIEESLISVHNLKRITSVPAEAAPDNTQRFALARQLLSTPDIGMRVIFLRGCRGEEGIGVRDRHLAGKIRALWKRCPGHLVHIGGWVHLIEDPANETLYSLLRDLEPRRILLDPDHPAPA